MRPHKEILIQGQLALLPLIKKFSADFYLAGGTALALQYGHRRSKWKDYVDLYFILKHHSLKEIVGQAHKYYTSGEFDEKLFRMQLTYHSDISYSEPIEYLPGFAVDDKTIKQKLTAISLA